MKIFLNKKVFVDLLKLIVSRLLIQANSGGGKSWAIRRIVEWAFGHVQIIVIDPEGEFGNMRSRFDFVYAGKDGDAPVESRSAALLARRLLELKASAIIDLYELPPQERKRYVRLFLEAMVNAPKELWHDCLVILDEAHVFAPEKDQSESLSAVIDMASRGRKRGYCLIPATQRPAKLNKDVAAECNNKLIGRASLDIDRKRAAEELGFTSKEQVLSLRDLEPGEFYAFGPAISREVIKVQIGDVEVKPAKRGVSKQSVPAPSATVKKILAKLADLPAEAAQEAKSISDLKGENAALKRQLQQKSVENGPKEVKKDAPMGVSQWMEYGRKYGYAAFFEKKAVKEWQDLVDSANKAIKKLQDALKSIGAASEVYKSVPVFAPPVNESNEAPPKHPEAERPLSYFENPRPHSKGLSIENKGVVNQELGAGERKVLIAIASNENGMSREHITVQTGYKRSTRDAYIQRLSQKEFIQLEANGRILATPDGIGALGNDYRPLPTGQDLIDHYLKTLPEGEAKIFKFLVDESTGAGHQRWFTRDEISEAVEYKRSTRDAYIQRLVSRQIVVTQFTKIAASEHILP